MGIINFVKGGVKELAVARPDEAKSDIIYKHPDQTIPMKAQLTVDQDEIWPCAELGLRRIAIALFREIHAAILHASPAPLWGGVRGGGVNASF